KVGQIVTVQVLSIDDNGKIALSMRNREKEAEEKKEQPKKEYQKRETSNRRPSKPFNKKQSNNNSQDFDSLMNDFLKESETRLSSIRKNTESKRGGRGGRRNSATLNYKMSKRQENPALFF